MKTYLIISHYQDEKVFSLNTDDLKTAQAIFEALKTADHKNIELLDLSNDKVTRPVLLDSANME